jgi:hypothetical protein
VEKARARVDAAFTACESARQRPARNALDGAARAANSAAAKVKSRSGRKIIPPAVATDLLDQLTPLTDDIRTLRRSLACI